MRHLLASAFVILSTVGCSSSDAVTNQSLPPAVADAGIDASHTVPFVDDAGSGVVDAGSDAGSIAPATGTVGGNAFTFMHGIAYARQVEVGTTPTDGYEILLSNESLDCGQFKVEGASTVDIDLAGTPPAAQAYPVIEDFDTSQSAGQASADFNAYDATCGTLISGGSLSGSVTITKFDTATVEGSFDIAFESSARVDEGSVAGTFTAIVCPTVSALSCDPH